MDGSAKFTCWRYVVMFCKKKKCEIELKYFNFRFDPAVPELGSR